MKKPRKLKTLYNVLLKNWSVDGEEEQGICIKIIDLEEFDLISLEEQDILLEHFKSHHQLAIDKFEAKNYGSIKGYWWTWEQHPIRKQFIKHLITLL